MPTAEMLKIHKEKGIPLETLEKKWAEAKHKAPKVNGEPNWAIVQTIFKKEIQNLTESFSDIVTVEEFIETKLSEIE